MFSSVEIFRISRQTFTDWRKKGYFKAIKIDRAVYVEKSEVERLLKEKTI